MAWVWQGRDGGEADGAGGATGGVLDDLMFANRGDHVLLVVNAANAQRDIAHLTEHLGDAVTPVTDRALMALQGPSAEAALSRIVPDVAEMRFMDVRIIDSTFGAMPRSESWRRIRMRSLM